MVQTRNSKLSTPQNHNKFLYKIQERWNDHLVRSWLMSSRKKTNSELGEAGSSPVSKNVLQV